MPENRSELQSVIDFFGTPYAVEVLFAIRDGRHPWECPELRPYGDAIDTAVAALAALGTVTGLTGPHPNGEPSPLALTPKGFEVCELVERVIDFGRPEDTTKRTPERAAIG